MSDAAITHLVLVRPAEGVEPAALDELARAFDELPAAIDGLERLVAGANVSPEHKDLGFTWGVAMRFAHDRARDAYATHERHLAIVEKVRALAADVLVCDLGGSW